MDIKTIKKIGQKAALVCVLALVGCGWVKSPETLYKEAKNLHGDCTVVSKTKTSDRSEVVLHDKLQNFDYEVVSSMSDIVIDGSNFGSLPGTSDSFNRRLCEKIVAEKEPEIKEICEKYGANYKFGDGGKTIIFLLLYLDDEAAAQKACMECAKVIQTENKNDRLDGSEICAYNASDDRYGSVVLPNIAWRTKADESIEYYTQVAHNNTDPAAEFVRTEDGVFADTGADLNRVVSVLGTDYPTEADSPVKFYYFKDSMGREFYICDFNYYDSEYRNFAFYTNYAGNSTTK